MHKPSTYIILRNDDPCALSDPARERRLLSLLERYGVAHVAAVTPRVVDDPHDDRPNTYHPLHRNQAMTALIRDCQRKGLLEVAQHGQTHQTNRFRPNRDYDRDSPESFPGIAGPWLPFSPAHPEGYSEFNGLPAAEQRRKIVEGKRYLERLLAVKLETFIFPWNSYSRESLRLVREAGFRYVLVDEECEADVRGLVVLAACVWGVEDFTEAVEMAMTQDAPTLLHLSFHSWMFSETDFVELERLLARLTKHEDVTFITPAQLPQVPYRVPLIVGLRKITRYLAHGVGEHITVPDEPDDAFYVLSVRHYVRRLLPLGTAYVIFKALGLSRMLAVSGVAAAVAAAVIVQTAATPSALSIVAGGVLVVSVFLLVNTLHLFGTRLRQQRAERAG